MNTAARRSNLPPAARAGARPLRRLAAWCLVLGLAGASPARAADALKPGATTEFSVKLPVALQELAAGGVGKPVTANRALCAVAVPENFDPARPWPVLVVSATSDPQHNSSRALLARFAAPALAAGWVVVAADPGAPVLVEQDTNSLRYALIQAALAVLKQDWPGSDRWPVAFGGFSGGAKRSAWLAALFTLDGRRPVGVFQGACNEPTMAEALRRYRPDRREFQSIPVFLSGGDADEIATPESQQEVRRALQAAGFKRVRAERFAGGHELNGGQIAAALKWFRP